MLGPIILQRSPSTRQRVICLTTKIQTSFGACIIFNQRADFDSKRRQAESTTPLLISNSFIPMYRQPWTPRFYGVRYSVNGVARRTRHRLPVPHSSHRAARPPLAFHRPSHQAMFLRRPRRYHRLLLTGCFRAASSHQTVRSLISRRTQCSATLRAMAYALSNSTPTTAPT